jgi:hypothetical protein
VSSNVQGGRPQVGDLVQDSTGRERVVTDIRDGRWVLRPVSSCREEQPVDDPNTLTVIAQRGEWS